MGYKIGIDFGTTNSTVSYVDSSNHLKAFRYPGPDGYEYIPSCVAYDSDGSISIGRAALTLAGVPEVTFCNNLKMILPLSEKDRGKYGWPEGKNPENVIADYFAHILTLDDEDASSFRMQKGQIEGIVLSVPHVWAKSMDHAGRSRLQAIVADNMNLPLIQLVSEPVAAAAYYAYKHQQDRSEIFQGNILICDMGGGTFDVTLCRVEPGKVEELYNDGNGRIGLGKAGVCFDRRLILGGRKEKEKSIDENGSDFFELYNKLQDFKINNHEKITKNLIIAIEDPDLRNKMIIRAGRTGFDFVAIQKAFEETEHGIIDVLQRFKSAIDEKRYSIDATFFVGGFAQFYLVREAIKKFWDIDQNDPRFIERINKEISRYAISYGAALVANGIMSVEEKYEHTVGIEGYVLAKVEGTDEEYTKETLKLPIIKGGRKLSEYENVQFAEYPIRAYNEKPKVVIFIDPESKNRIIKQELPGSLNIKVPNASIPGNRWKVGMRINKSKVVYLTFEDTQGKRAEYELGDILREMFGGLEIVQAERE